MNDDRTSKSLADRVDIGFFRRSNSFRRWRWGLSLAALAASLGWIALAESRDDRRLYQAGPLSRAHRLLENDCQQCHKTPWQTAWRFDPDATPIHSTPDAACLKCHHGETHHADQLANKQTACADCHREHRGRAALSEVSNAMCLQCHDDLRTTAGTSVNFARTIHGFASHPQFALLRKPADHPGPGHKAHEVAELDGDHWRDKAQIRLNHQKHLNPKGIPRRPGDPTPVVLTCVKCHQPDATGRLMQPISFEKHCADCHADQLRYEIEPPPQIVGEAIKEFDRPLPHREPANVRGVLRDRLTRLIAAQPELATGGGKSDKPRPDDSREPATRLFPGEAPAEQLSQQSWAWVDGQMTKAENLLFQEKLDPAGKGVGCAYCHRVERHGSDVIVTEPKIPPKWLQHAQFDHEHHQMLDCLACHADAAKSESTSDILLPSVESCKTCHQEATLLGPSKARSDCVECHKYHAPSTTPFQGELPIDLLKDSTAKGPK